MTSQITDYDDDCPVLPHPKAHLFDPASWDTPGRCICTAQLPPQNDWHHAGRDWQHTLCTTCGTLYVDEETYTAIYDPGTLDADQLDGCTRCVQALAECSTPSQPVAFERGSEPVGAGMTTDGDAEQAALDDELLRLVSRAIFDPGQLTARGDNFEESLTQWQARAVVVAAGPLVGRLRSMRSVAKRLRDGWRPGKCMAVVMAGSPRPDPVPVWMPPTHRQDSEPMTDAERLALDDLDKETADGQ